LYKPHGICHELCRAILTEGFSLLQVKQSRKHGHTQPSALHAALAHALLFSRAWPLCATHAHLLQDTAPTSTRSTGFCFIWVCISSSSPKLLVCGAKKGAGRLAARWVYIGWNAAPYSCPVISYLRRPHKRPGNGFACLCKPIFSNRRVLQSETKEKEQTAGRRSNLHSGHLCP
jgi:hypothetical protein